MQRVLLGTAGAVVAAAVVSAVPTPASAIAPDVFVRYEEDARAGWAVVEDCADGTQAEVLVSVIGGLEFESPDLANVDEFVNVQVQGARCDGTFVSGRGNGPAAAYEGSPTLRRARVIGTVTLDGAPLVSGPSESATFRTFEDLNVTYGAA